MNGKWKMTSCTLQRGVISKGLLISRCGAAWNQLGKSSKKIYLCLILIYLLIFSAACGGNTDEKSGTLELFTSSITQPSKKAAETKTSETAANYNDNSDDNQENDPAQYEYDDYEDQPQNNNPPADTPDSTDPVMSGAFSDADIACYYNGAYIRPHDDMQSVLSQIGNAISVSTATSCFGSGFDNIYQYNGFRIVAYQEGSAEKVLSIELHSSNAATSRGITVGMNQDSILQAYGSSAYISEFYYSYYGSNSLSLEFLVDGGIITGINIGVIV